MPMRKRPCSPFSARLKVFARRQPALIDRALESRETTSGVSQVSFAGSLGF